MRACALLLVLAAAANAGDLEAIRHEPNLEKRSKLALGNAWAALDAAKAAYQKGDLKETAQSADEITASVNLADEALTATGKDPRRSPRWFKYAETQTRELLRRLDSFEHDMSFSDRDILVKVKDEVQQVHDRLLLGLLEGKPK